MEKKTRLGRFLMHLPFIVIYFRSVPWAPRDETEEAGYCVWSGHLLRGRLLFVSYAGQGATRPSQETERRQLSQGTKRSDHCLAIKCYHINAWKTFREWMKVSCLWSYDGDILSASPKMPSSYSNAYLYILHYTAIKYLHCSMNLELCIIAFAS